MKIGILTHHTVVNFGAFWQAFALQEAVKRLYPEAKVEIINYIDLKHFSINLAGWFLSPGNSRKISEWSNTYALPFTLKRFRKKYMDLSPLCFSVNAINKLNYDSIIIGSDEVWNYDDWKTANSIKFGLGLTCKNIISYAPSAANTNIEHIPEEIKNGLKKFSHISARDEKTAILAEQATGKKVTRVLDPTFLGEIKTEKNPFLPECDYILFYYCQNLPDKVLNQIKEYAKKYGLKILGAGENTYEYEQCTVNMTPFQWAEMFRHAKFVFTGTFHGAVFSILNKIPFKVYLTNPGRVEKVGALLSFLNIKNREIDNDYIFDLSKEINGIDYAKIYETIAVKRQESLAYLKDALKI